VSNLDAWFSRFISHPHVVKRFGNIKCCEVAMAPLGVKVEQEENDDDMDLFGDDDEEALEAAKQKAAEQAKGKKEKKKEVEKSMITFEVKPLDDEVNLDDLAKAIMEIKGEGITWNANVKKEPVAFGIFKLVIAVTVVDSLVSVDDLQEKIEALENMVQSVEIATFTKI
jgi:translation elongation factor EF-1beta